MSLMRAGVFGLAVWFFLSLAPSPASAPPSRLALTVQAAVTSPADISQRVSTCVLPDIVCADFSWEVADRFTPVWLSWSRDDRRNYSRSVLRQPFSLAFDACRARGGRTPINLYSWVVRGVDDPGFSQSREVESCQLSIQVPAEGAYEVLLTVRGQDGQAATTMQRVVLKDLLIVSIGDSYASGEGNPDVPRGPTSPGSWQDRRCHRSRFSGPAQAAWELERRDEQSTVTFLSYACSGAQIRKGLIGEYLGLIPQRPPIPPQIKAAATLLCGDELCDRPEDPTIDVLLISIGGNDVGFSAAILACAARLEDIADRTLQRIIRIGFIPKKDCHQQPGLTRFVEGRFRELPGLYEELRQEISTRLKVDTLYISEYPVDFFDSRAGCGTLELVTATEAQWLASQGQRLNQIIHNSWRPGWTNIGNDRWRRTRRWDVISEIASGFAGYGYCATPTYYGHLGRSITQQLDYLGFLHPNADGHRVYKDAILRKLQTVREQIIRFPP